MLLLDVTQLLPKHVTNESTCAAHADNISNWDLVSSTLQYVIWTDVYVSIIYWNLIASCFQFVSLFFR
jgi:hypothetical protein